MGENTLANLLVWLLETMRKARIEKKTSTTTQGENSSSTSTCKDKRIFITKPPTMRRKMAAPHLDFWEKVEFEVYDASSPKEEGEFSEEYKHHIDPSLPSDLFVMLSKGPEAS